MIITIPTLGIQQEVNDWKLSKELTDNRINRTLDANVQFNGDAYKLLLQETLTGKGLDVATFTEKCDEDDIVISCNILHNEGKIKNNSCIYQKKVFIKDPLTCMKDAEQNIFNYPSKKINSIQGNVERWTYEKTGVIVFTDSDHPTLQELQLAVGGVPNHGEGWYVTYIVLAASAIYHTAKVIVTYTKITSLIKYDENWKPFGSNPNLFYYAGYTPSQWSVPTIYKEQTADGLEVQITYIYGRELNYTNKEISNCVNFNDVVENIFECTGISLVSNFFGINSDNSQPNNDVYAYALQYMQNIYIAQSFDIIRESAITDSFGDSGKFKSKKMVESLLTLFNLIMTIDTVTNVIRLEHVSYYISKGIDFTINNKEYGIDDTLEVNKDLIGSETWTMAAITPNSYDSKITYDVIGETQDKEYKIEYILTDVLGTINNKEFEGSEYKKLFYLIQTDGNNIIGLNSGLSLNNIIKQFHYYNRALPRGKHDNKDVQFNGFSFGITTKLNYEGSLKDFLKLNPTNTVKTRLGIFMITSIEITNKGTIKMNIKK